jgi:uncharacterized alpha-E superfamily protein
MLLSRVADSLYWISRYLERAEHTARLIDVAVDHGLGRTSPVDGSAIDRLYQSIGLDQAGPSAALAGVALFDIGNRSSVASCITTARENARQVREEISSEMWQQLNELYLRVKEMREEGSWSARTHFAARGVIEGVHLFQGVTDATMAHGEGWQYLQVGRYLERAAVTATLLELFVADGHDQEPAARDQVEWVALLRSCSALEAYCRHYTADVRGQRVTEFLLLNDEFPRSACRPSAGVARIWTGGRDPERRTAGVLVRHQPAVRADPHGADSELRLVSGGYGAACVAGRKTQSREPNVESPEPKQICATPSATSRASPTTARSPRV